jgi:hypothetical protein
VIIGFSKFCYDMRKFSIIAISFADILDD